MTRQLHLLVNITGVGNHPAAWTRSGPAPDAYVDPEHHLRVARTAEPAPSTGCSSPTSPPSTATSAKAPGRAWSRPCC